MVPSFHDARDSKLTWILSRGGHSAAAAHPGQPDYCHAAASTSALDRPRSGMTLAGAMVIGEDVQDGIMGHVALADPERNEFCKP